MRKASLLVVLGVVLGSTPAWARHHHHHHHHHAAFHGIACVDSYGTQIHGIKTRKACEALGARWARVGTKHLPKSARRKRHRRARRHGRREYGRRE